MVEKKKKEKRSKKKWSDWKKIVILFLIAAVIIGTATGIQVYLSHYYKATDQAKEAILGNEDVTVVKTNRYYYFTLGKIKIAGGKPQDSTEKFTNKNSNVEPSTIIRDTEYEAKGGIIFYPGGKVEETAYAPLMLELTELGYDVFLVRMPAKLAVFGVNRADSIINANPQITNWTMMGHSLGGAMAAKYVSETDNKIDRLVLLAAYSTANLSSRNMKVISMYGTEDGVLNRDKLEKNADNLPANAYVYEIPGGNHAQFGNYGTQKGDNPATITRKEQQQEVLDLLEYFENNEQ